MSKILTLVFLIFASFTLLFSHEDYHKRHDSVQGSIYLAQGQQPHVEELKGKPESWLEWIGGFHFIFLHFPIALIVMTAISEIFFAWYSQPIFDYASRFMLVTAAILAAPTALFGFLYSYTESYEGLLADFFWWHMWLGITTAILAFIVAYFRLLYGRSRVYYISLFLLFLLVNTTATFGGGLTFGPYHLVPPI